MVNFKLNHIYLASFKVCHLFYLFHKVYALDAADTSSLQNMCSTYNGST